jgi:hypothetical protein
MPVPEDDAGKRLRAKVGERRPLRLRERPYLALCELDVLAELRIDRRGRTLKLCVRDEKLGGIPIVQLARPTPRSGQSVCLDVGEDLRHPRPNTSAGLT